MCTFPIIGVKNSLKASILSTLLVNEGSKYVTSSHELSLKPIGSPLYHLSKVAFSLAKMIFLILSTFMDVILLVWLFFEQPNIKQIVEIRKKELFRIFIKFNLIESMSFKMPVNV